MNKFNVGDRVKCVYVRTPVAKVLGRYARVTEYVLPSVFRVKWEESDIDALVNGQDPAGRDHNGIHWGDCWWVLAPVLFDPGKPAQHRDGTPVAMYFYDKGCPRPYISSYKGLRLTFEESGLFYPDGESPCDLVNS